MCNLDRQLDSKKHQRKAQSHTYLFSPSKLTTGFSKFTSFGLHCCKGQKDQVCYAKDFFPQKRNHHGWEINTLSNIETERKRESEETQYIIKKLEDFGIYKTKIT